MIRIESDRLPEPYRSRHATALLAVDEALGAMIAALVEKHGDSLPELAGAHALAWEDAGMIARTIQTAGEKVRPHAFGQDLAEPVRAYRDAVIAEREIIDAMLSSLIPDSSVGESAHACEPALQG